MDKTLPAMLKNYLKTAYRNIIRNKVYALLNILGLAIGISCFSLIILHVENEFSYDQFHEHQSYRLLYRQATGDGDSRTSGIARISSAEEIAENVAGIRDKLFLRDFAFGPVVLSHKDVNIKTRRILFAEQGFFDYFSFHMLQGDAETALADPKGIVLTRSMADRIFGKVNPMGELLRVSGMFEVTLQVTGIMEDPKNSHFDFDFIFPFEMQAEGTGVITRNWLSRSMYTYFKLDEGTDPGEVERRIKAYFLRTREGAELEYVQQETPILQPVEAIYFGSSDVSFDSGFKKGDKRSILILAAIGGFILLVACINYVNIATAKAMNRAKEIGMRKVLGAYKRQLIGQFMGEAFLITFLAVILSVLLTDLLLPYFNHMLGKTLRFTLAGHAFYYQILAGLLAGVTLLSGLYPAFVLSSFRPSDSLKGPGAGLLRGNRMRKVLITVQLFVTLALISAVLLVIKQTRFIDGMDLGFQKKDIVIIPVNSNPIGKNIMTYKAELLRNPNITHFTTGMDVMAFGSTNNSFYVIPEGHTLKQGIMSTYFTVGMDFIDIHKMKIVKGRTFDPNLNTDSTALVINEKLAGSLGLEDPVGKKVKIWGEEAEPQTIIGVVKDFNFQSLHHEVNPALFTVSRGTHWFITLKIVPGSEKEVLAYARERWEAIDSVYPFGYLFLDDQLAGFYVNENRLLSVTRAFAVICIIIACMGLYGMTAFTIEQKIKEIGIRKVLGAGVDQLVWLVNRRFVKLFLIAVLTAVPLVYYAVSRWLEGFAYHTEIGALSFLITGIVVLVIMGVTVSWQAVRAAWINPVKTLRHE